VTGSSSELRRCLGPLPSALTRGDMRALPGSSATPLRTCPALRPRRTPHIRPVRCTGYCLPHRLTASAPRSVTFRGSITQPARSLSTLHGPDHSDTAQDSLPTGGHPWWDRTLTCRVASGGFHSVRHLTSFSPPRSFSWRTNRRDAVTLAMKQPARPAGRSRAVPASRQSWAAPKR